jgi:serine/threonine protein kinase
MLVMEALDGADFMLGREAPDVMERLRQVVKNLHDAGFVHGDLRPNNIRVVGQRVCLFDFDWSGRAGESRYPGFMNHHSIEWAPGASEGLPMQAEHDVFMLNGLAKNSH